MDFDEILEEIGEFGKYQKTNYLLICLPVFFAAGIWNFISSQFQEFLISSNFSK